MSNWQRGLAILLLLPMAASVWAREREKARDSQKSSRSGGDRTGTQPATQDPNYVIGPEDVLDIRVFKEQDLSLSNVRVRPDGKISVPLLNDVQAEGLTPNQLGATITESLKKYLTDPKVTVIVMQNTGQRIYVVGEVARPGSLSLLPNMTIVQALALAGGFTEYANRKGTYILRTENGKSTLLHFNYKKALRGDVAENVNLKDGDTIVVP